ncbi:MAG: DNA (cytosine-5-)-methyltransferase [Acidimicrobiia bacterium]|nr:DNA (cytosine-5-)-methyltransferase [Acidimicrobiia bacterium]MYE74075.1 DNA (cytosine-5-)-methyltransferase [Acidimicrobiia bacterium]MYJ63372.1 DNA (cytosine-5-)-methyltransferase [Acidimicrobiia bacterium]
MKSNTNGCDGSTLQSRGQLALAEPNGSVGLQVASSRGHKLSAAEFFAGIGLVRAGLERVGVDVVWANDIEPVKHAVYASNFDSAHYVLGDIRGVQGCSVPSVDVATASFPCVDLSLAGNRKGLEGEQSGLFFEFSRVLREMGERIPPVVMIENVSSFVSSRGGEDLRVSIAELNKLGYVCDLLTVDASWFVAQSRPRLFIIGTLEPLGGAATGVAGPLRSESVAAFMEANQDLMLQELLLPIPLQDDRQLCDVVERLDPEDERWWDGERFGKFMRSLSPLNQDRLALLKQDRATQWRTAYRRTRNGVPVWEIRSDDISGCLRTARGGSSRQAVVEVSPDGVRARWMTPREYARLQGVPDEFDYSAVTDAQALFGFGDAVCVPVIEWLAEHALVPAVMAVGNQVPAKAAV